MRFIIAAAVLGLAIAGAAAAQDAPLPRAAVEADFTRLDCFVEIDEALRNQQSFALGGGKRLVLVPCLRGAYQGSSIAYVVGSGSGPQLLSFPTWDGKRFTPSEFVTEADFDPAKKEMSSFAKGRGVGDCGSLATWTWTGDAFEVKSYYYKDKCDGRRFAGQECWRVYPRSKPR